MKLHKVEIQLYADNEEQARQAGIALNGFVAQVLSKGHAVTAPKIVEGIALWQNNPFVRSKILNHFPRIKRQ